MFRSFVLLSVVCIIVMLGGCQSVPTREEWAAMTPEDREYYQLQQQERLARQARISAWLAARRASRNRPYNCTTIGSSTTCR